MRGYCFEGLGITLQGHLDGFVPDGVDADLVPGFLSVHDQFIQLLLRLVEDSEIGRLARISFTHGRRAGSPGAVQHELVRSQPQSFISVPGDQPGLKVMFPQLNGGPAGADLEVNPDLQPAFGYRRLEGADLLRIAAAGIGGAGDPVPEKILVHDLHPADKVLIGPAGCPSEWEPAPVHRVTRSALLFYPGRFFRRGGPEYPFQFQTPSGPGSLPPLGGRRSAG